MRRSGPNKEGTSLGDRGLRPGPQRDKEQEPGQREKTQKSATWNPGTRPM
jgi:hypothetical protein